MDELQYQKSLSDYQIAANSAMIISTWANAQKKGSRYKIKDFIGNPPQRNNAKETLIKASEKAGIKLPKGEYERTIKRRKIHSQARRQGLRIESDKP